MLLKKGMILINVDNVATIPDFKPGDIVTNPLVSPSMKIVRKNDIAESSIGYALVNLFLFVQEDAYPGDFEIESDNSSLGMVKPVKKFTENCFRLIATTNKAIPSARLSKQFLNEFVDKDGITEVEVVYVETQEKLVISKNKRNIVELGNRKDQYTGEEVVIKIMDLVTEVYDDQAKNLVVEWCDDNI